MRVRWIVLPVVGCLGAFLALGLWLDYTGYVPPTDPPPAHVIKGSFTLVDDATAANGCVGPSDGNWREVHPGAEVEVRNGDNWLIGTGSLGDGEAGTWGQFAEKACTYSFTVGVADAEAYKIHYPGGLSHSYTFDEMQAHEWAVGSACCTIVPGS